MDEREMQAYGRLPDPLICYRGCGFANIVGASWTLDRRVANAFPFKQRFRCSEPLLVTGTVRKHKVLAVKLDREEAEIISFSVRRLRVEPADQSDAEAYHAESHRKQMAELERYRGVTS